MAKIGGSWAYGQPNAQSDLDLVVQLTEEDEALLRRVLGLPDMGPIRIGLLNLIVARTNEQYKTWCDGIEHLKFMSQPLEVFGARRPISRENAIAYFDELFQRRKVDQVVNGADSKTGYEERLRRRGL